LKVQRISNKRTETNSCLRTREKLRDELPLRGHLTCPECGKPWTGSISSGNGGKYPYYHCERSCKVRVNADFANERFLQFLGTLQPPQEIIDLQMAMIEVLCSREDAQREAQDHIERAREALIEALGHSAAAGVAIECPPLAIYECYQAVEAWKDAAQE